MRAPPGTHLGSPHGQAKACATQVLAQREGCDSRLNLSQHPKFVRCAVQPPSKNLLSHVPVFGLLQQSSCRFCCHCCHRCYWNNSQGLDRKHGLKNQTVVKLQWLFSSLGPNMIRHPEAVNKLKAESFLREALHETCSAHPWPCDSSMPSHSCCKQRTALKPRIALLVLAQSINILTETGPTVKQQPAEDQPHATLLTETACFTDFRRSTAR